jgi:Flp pilus assembly secretin CpaC
MTEAAMNISKRAVLAGVVLIATVFAMTAVMAQSSSSANTGSTGANIQLDFRMGTIEDKTRTVVKSYRLIVASGSSGASLLAGERIAFPTMDSGLPQNPEGDVATGRPIVYQNIGFATTVEAIIIEGNRIVLRAEIENSIVVESEGNGLPVVATRQLSVNVILNDGQPLEVTRAEGLMDRPGFVEVEARILK